MDVRAGQPVILETPGMAVLLLIVPPDAVPPRPGGQAYRTMEAAWAPGEDADQLVLRCLWRAEAPHADHPLWFAFDLADVDQGGAVDRLAEHGSVGREVTVCLALTEEGRMHAATGLARGDVALIDRHTIGIGDLDCRPLALLDRA